MDSGAVGFVVIGRNEGDRLIDSLRSVLALSNRVVYADSASTDGSAERARALGAIVAAVPPDGPMTAARGRNLGYALLRERFPDTEFVQFIDGDCILDPGFVPKALRFMGDHEAQRFRHEARIENAVAVDELDELRVGKALAEEGISEVASARRSHRSVGWDRRDDRSKRPRAFGAAISGCRVRVDDAVRQREDTPQAVDQTVALVAADDDEPDRPRIHLHALDQDRE